VNTEELEKSLRAEFESQMKNVLAAARDDVADFQKNIEAQFEEHRSQGERCISGLVGTT
jgi:hypothetical protein